jgi:hypothetical protein
MRWRNMTKFNDAELRYRIRDTDSTINRIAYNLPGTSTKVGLMLQRSFNE